MQLPPFLLEQWLSKYELASPPIEYNLAASTGPKWTVGELLEITGDDTREMLDALTMSYAPPAGGADLRTAIAGLHDVDPESVAVTTGASEALLMLFCLHAAPDANVVLPAPVFPAMPAVAEAWGLGVKRYELRRDDGFEHLAAPILDAVDDRTRLVLVNTPHNPSGAVMPPDELARLADSLADRDVLLVVDEVYHPLYFGDRRPTAAGLPNTVVLGDVSKAYSLSGLRVGWLIDGDAKRRHRLVDLRSYFTISGSPVTEYLAAKALANADILLRRLETVASSNLTLLTEFVEARSESIDWVKPRGGTTAFPWFRDGRDSRAFCEAVAARGVLTVPGYCFDAPEHFRIGFGVQAAGFGDALAIAGDVLRQGRA